MRHLANLAVAKASGVETGKAGGTGCRKTLNHRAGLRVGEAAHPVAVSRHQSLRGGRCDHGSTITVGDAISAASQHCQNSQTCRAFGRGLSLCNAWQSLDHEGSISRPRPWRTG